MPDPQVAPTIQLILQPTLKVAGEVIEGAVHLNFPGLIREKIEEVHVKLRCIVHTKITRQNSHGNTGTDSQRINLAMENVSLWSAGNGVYPPPGSDVLAIPFSFTLPANLLPTCEFGNLRSEFVQIRNYVEVVGKRPGLLRSNQRVLRPFPVLPPSHSGAELRETILRGWEGPWRKFPRRKQVRKGLWGELSEVEMTLILPDIEALPLFTPIPFTLTFVTHSKVMKRNDRSPEDTIFPTPPSEPRAVEFWLESDVWLKTKTRDATCYDNFIAQLGSLGTRKPSSETPVAVDVVKKVWIPADGEEKGEKGRWKQEVTFKSALQLTCAPTFTSEAVKVSHKMKLKVNYGGIGNTHEAEIPIQIVSSMYPPGERAWDGPPPEISLPPGYFRGTWDEDVDEKD